MKKLLLLFFVLLVFPLAQAITVTHTGSFTAGDSLNITINMENSSYAGNVSWNTTSSNNLTWTLVNGSGTFNAAAENYTFHANDSGVVVLGLTSTVAETFDVTAYNGSTTNLTSVTVNPASAVTFYMSHDGSGTAGVAENIAISAKDTYNNTDTNYNDKVILTTTAADSSTLTWSAGVTEWDGSGNWEYTFSSGSTNLNLTNTYAEALTVTASLAGMTSFTSPALVFSHAAVNHFSLTHDGYSVVNTAETVTFTAQDAFNNTVSNYTGDVFLDSNVSDSDTLTWSGVHLVLSSEGSETFTVTSNTSQSLFLNATDLNSITGTSDTLVFANPSISVSASSGDIGSTLTVTGTGFEADTSVTVALSSATNATTTDANGALSVTLTVPQIANNTYNITAGTANVEFSVNPTYVGFAATSPSAVTITNPVSGSTGTTSFVVSALGNMDVNITNITVTNLTNDALDYTIDSVSFDSTSFVFGWSATKTVTATVTLSGTPVDGTYTGIATVTDSNGNTEQVNLSTVLQTGVYSLSVASTAAISGDTDDTTRTTSLTITNNGSLSLSNVILGYSSSDSSSGKVSFGNSFNLSASGSQAVTVTADITDLDVGTYSGTITVTTTEETSATITLTITVTEAPEEALSFYDVDSNEENNLVDGEELNSIKPGSTLTLEVTIKNIVSFDLEDVVVKATIEDIDDGDDLEADDYDIGNLNDGNKEEATFSFDIPWELDRNSYDLVLEVEGEDDDGDEYSKEITIKLDVERKTHDVAISNADLGLSTLQCVRSTSLNVDITNTGERDENDAVLVVKSSALGIDFVKEDIDLDEAETYSEYIAIHLDDDFAAGTYTIIIESYYDDDEYADDDITDYKTVGLIVEDCGTTTVPTTTITVPTTTTTTTTTAPIPTTTEISFTDSSGYVLTLVLANVLLLVIILFFVVKTLTQRRR